MVFTFSDEQSVTYPNRIEDAFCDTRLKPDSVRSCFRNCPGILVIYLQLLGTVVLFVSYSLYQHIIAVDLLLKLIIHSLSLVSRPHPQPLFTVE